MTTRIPIEITSRCGDAVLLSRADYEALEETAHLLRVPGLRPAADREPAAGTVWSTARARPVFSSHGWEDYSYWLSADHVTLKRINRLSDDPLRDAGTGSSKPLPVQSRPLRPVLGAVFGHRLP